MNLKLKSVATFAAIAAMSFAATACQQAANNATTSTSTTTTTTESTSTAATDTNAATASTNAAPAAGDSGTPAAATASNIPAECQGYLNAVQACVDHLSSQNPAVAAQFRTTMDQTRASWAAITNQQALATACTAATNAFNSSAHAMGC